KRWLKAYDKNNIIKKQTGNIPISHFINKELIHFSHESLKRAIPSICDGFKESQRKVLYGCFKKKIEHNKIKVAQLGAYISENTHYQHGEASLYGTIIKMAQNFVGTNNINLLKPLGNFGFRRAGGKEAASERYIFTQLNKLTPLLFKREDSYILEKQFEDNDEIEPVNFAPILPIVLINGVSGIATGYSTDIPSFNPLDIINAITCLIKEEEYKELKPWYDGFVGTIEKKSDYKYESIGKYEILDESNIRITEIPVNQSILDYFNFLEFCLIDGDKP
ncbi:MAG: hypothetical protein COY57_04510, partial [Flavobacteriales bacterium CG_4_10_14_0_8_um_filter_32_5]